MKIINSFRVALSLFSFSMGAFAQCAPGQTPYPYQYTPNGPVTWQCHGGQSPQSSLRAPPVQWEERFGAIATDAGCSYESASNMTSAIAADRTALDQCRAKGGHECKILLAYHNGCAVIVYGDTTDAAASGPTVEAAAKRGLQQCSAATTNCHVEFNTCSLPVRIQ